jgi:hypothetical protein
MRAPIDIQGIVNRLSTECSEAHRGAFWWDEARRVAVAFGNDGYNGEDGRARREVEAVRQLLAESGGRELGFATDPEGGYSWALACELPASLSPDVLTQTLWVAWFRASREAGSVGAELSEEFWRLQANIAGAILERNGLI